ncbi:hypothetical protein D3C86_1341510 [compost metagenome]
MVQHRMDLIQNIALDKRLGIGFKGFFKLLFEVFKLVDVLVDDRQFQVVAYETEQLEQQFDLGRQVFFDGLVSGNRRTFDVYLSV